MSSPIFSSPSFKKILNSYYKLIAVYTKYNLKKNFYLTNKNNFVYDISSINSIYTYYLNKLKINNLIYQLFFLKPDIIIVISYGLILPYNILNIPKYGFFNIHPSSLPKWRGTSPIENSIMSGDKNTSICIIKLINKLDAGNIFIKENITLKNNIIKKNLYFLCSQISSKILIKILHFFLKKKFYNCKQKKTKKKYTNKILNKHQKIKLNKTSYNIINNIKSLDINITMYFFYKKIIIKIISAQMINLKHYLIYGIIIDSKLTITCNKGLIKFFLLQRQNKKILNIVKFIMGLNILMDTFLM